ncbi:Glutaredoxin-C6 [Platanthera zijinensis]|uniref:Glutaredoxin-C6 n=1 Tax=Platanthera zijinensis TaxID=2320716 RepID=A0AAP0B9B3_9ASPA
MTIDQKDSPAGRCEYTASGVAFYLLSLAKISVRDSPRTPFHGARCPPATPKRAQLDWQNRGDGAELQSALAAWTGQRVVPNIFIGGNHIGGKAKTLIEDYEEGMKAYFDAWKTWIYLYKQVVPGNPLDDLKLAGNTIGSLVRTSKLKREMGLGVQDRQSFDRTCMIVGNGPVECKSSSPTWIATHGPIPD